MIQQKIHYTSLEKVSKKYFMRTSNLYTTVTTKKNIQNYYNEKWTYNGNRYCNLLYKLKVMELLKLYSK